MKNPPKFVTFTGVDEHTSTLGLQVLSEMYPVEWGVLFSPDRQGEGRYPTLHAVQTIAAVPRLRLAAHLCGRYANEFIETGGVADLADLLLAFPRIQVNTMRKDVDPARIAAFGKEYHAAVILQCRGEFPSSRDVTWLFDASGGRGITPASWPIAPLGDRTMVGYAGGLGPDDVEDALDVISRSAECYYIDMASKVRDEQDRFSLQRCTAVLHAVFGTERSSTASATLEAT